MFSMFVPRSGAAAGRVVLLWFAAWCVAGRTADAQLNFESEPINYNTAPTSDRVSKLQSQLDAGELTLRYDDEHGYLKSLLEHLDVPMSSQMLVFSKTSFQLRRITPQRPRALYFNDDTYIGWVQNGDVIEISTAEDRKSVV